MKNSFYVLEMILSTELT